MEISQHLRNIQPSYIREILAAAKADGVISLAGGLPDSRNLPVSLLMEAVQNLPSTPEVFQYGETAGYGPLLEYLHAHYAIPNAVSTLITNGSQQGLDLVARAFLDPNDVVAMEAPSYLGALQVFGLAQAHIETVQQNSQGPDLEQLATLFHEQKPKLFYAVPDFHNPTGVSWSLSVRQAVAKLCIDHQVTLVEDVPYRELRFSGEALPIVSSFCPQQSITLRSFSKISVPGIRLGLVAAPDAWLQAMIKVKQAADLHTALPMQAALLNMLKMPAFTDHLQTIQNLYAGRYQALSDSLTQLLDKGCSFNKVDGGMFVWLSVPAGDPMQLAAAALDRGVAVVPGSVFYSQGTVALPALRLNFSHSTPDELSEAVTRLSQVIQC